jgi:hypothetical protein
MFITMAVRVVDPYLRYICVAKWGKESRREQNRTSMYNLPVLAPGMTRHSGARRISD